MLDLLKVEASIQRRHPTTLFGVADMGEGMNRILLDQPPGEVAAVMRRDFFQITVIIRVAEFAKNPGAGRAPIAAEVIDQRRKIMQVSVKMIVVEVGIIVRQAAVSLARAAVVTGERAADSAAQNAVKLTEEFGINAAPKFAAEAVNHNRRVMVYLRQNIYIFDRGLFAQARCDLRQPHRQF